MEFCCLKTHPNENVFQCLLTQEIIPEYSVYLNTTQENVPDSSVCLHVTKSVVPESSVCLNMTKESSVCLNLTKEVVSELIACPVMARDPISKLAVCPVMTTKAVINPFSVLLDLPWWSPASLLVDFSFPFCLDFGSAFFAPVLFLEHLEPAPSRWGVRGVVLLYFWPLLFLPLVTRGLITCSPQTPFPIVLSLSGLVYAICYA